MAILVDHMALDASTLTAADVRALAETVVRLDEQIGPSKVAIVVPESAHLRIRPHVRAASWSRPSAVPRVLCATRRAQMAQRTAVTGRAAALTHFGNVKGLRDAGPSTSRSGAVLSSGGSGRCLPQDLVARVVCVDAHPVVVDALTGLPEILDVDPVVVRA